MSNPLEGMPDTDELHGQALENELAAPVDVAAMKKVKKDAQLPRGGYLTVPPLFMDGPEPDHQYSEGRIIARYNGMIRGTDRKTAGKQGRIRFRISHQRRNKPDGTPDNAIKLFQQAADAYQRVTGQVPTVQAVYSWVAQFPVVLTVIPGDRSEIVMGIKEARQ